MVHVLILRPTVSSDASRNHRMFGLPNAQRGQLLPSTETNRVVYPQGPVNRERESFEESPFRGANRKGLLTGKAVVGRESGSLGCRR